MQCGIAGRIENADPDVLLPAAWFHDCVHVPKNSPDRSRASQIAAAKALEELKLMAYPDSSLSAIEHAIEAHSFSAGIAPRTIEAKVLQDADRLEAVGAIGIARCFMTGGSLGQEIVHDSEPFPIDRVADDKVYSVDHFFLKLLRLNETMQTLSGREECRRRTLFLLQFLDQLRHELGVDEAKLSQALQRYDIEM